MPMGRPPTRQLRSLKHCPMVSAEAKLLRPTTVTMATMEIVTESVILVVCDQCGGLRQKFGLWHLCRWLPFAPLTLRRVTTKVDQCVMSGYLTGVRMLWPSIRRAERRRCLYNLSRTATKVKGTLRIILVFLFLASPFLQPSGGAATRLSHVSATETPNRMTKSNALLVSKSYDISCTQNELAFLVDDNGLSQLPQRGIGGCTLHRQ